MILENFYERGFVLTRFVSEVYNDKELYKLENNTTIFAMFGLLVFPMLSYSIEKLFANGFIPKFLIDVLIFILMTSHLVYPVVMI